MTKKEAELALLNGNRIRHTHYSPEEFVCMIDGKLYTEDGCNMGEFFDEFWSIYQKWEDEWEIIEAPEELKTYHISGTQFYAVNCTLAEALKLAEEYDSYVWITTIKAPSMFIRCVMDGISIEGMSNFLKNSNEHALK